MFATSSCDLKTRIVIQVVAVNLVNSKLLLLVDNKHSEIQSSLRAAIMKISVVVPMEKIVGIQWFIPLAQ